MPGMLTVRDSTNALLPIRENMGSFQVMLKRDLREINSKSLLIAYQKNIKINK